MFANHMLHDKEGSNNRSIRGLSPLQYSEMIFAGENFVE